MMAEPIPDRIYNDVAETMTGLFATTRPRTCAYCGAPVDDPLYVHEFDHMKITVWVCETHYEAAFKKGWNDARNNLDGNRD